jgi:hypothetical protein
MTQSNSTENKYFDLHTSGIGYLNRIREVSVRKGNPFMAVTVAALHGSADAVEYTYIDCKVAGGEADSLVRRCQQAENSGKKVLVAFRVSDLWIDMFTYEKGDKKGQTGASLKGRLLYISWIRIDGEQVYQAPSKDQPASSTAVASNADDKIESFASTQPQAQTPSEPVEPVEPFDAAPSTRRPAKPSLRRKAAA